MTPAQLAQLHAACFADARAWTDAEFAALLNQPGTRLACAAHGFCLVRVIADEAEVLTLAVDPPYRRQGLARMVLQDAEQQAANAGAVQVFLEVAADNAAARALYQKAGYRQVGERPGYYLHKDKAAVAALILQKQLGDI
ncbi:ribosomal protein S18-alanine N-acetyltransferase [Yoonia sp. SS1-5]|uniref:[Ribosomal protein bS18]-alanine N-acetyltransferase n=1 Tax=Yoonia rhodophyticola TaxID=3137370 RepID=A0AAN0NKI8_9RHOB